MSEPFPTGPGHDATVPLSYLYFNGHFLSYADRRGMPLHCIQDDNVPVTLFTNVFTERQGNSDQTAVSYL